MNILPVQPVKQLPEVIFKKASYKYEILKPVVFEMLEAINGHLIRKQDKVLIKPNFLLPAAQEKAVTTHPLVIKAVAEYALGKGARVQISDSPATGSFKKILEKGGYNKAFADINIEFKEFTASAKVDIGEPFGKIDMARDALEADVVINLAKLKTHSQMLLTLGVKNMFGCIIGFNKPEWHLRIGVDRQMFAKLLVQICKAVNPSITVIDGILAMEGQGPGKGGTPRRLGILAGGRDVLAVDKAVCNMLGVNPDAILTNATAREMGLARDGINICGDFDMINNFRLPEIVSLTFGPNLFKKFMRRHLIQRPVADNTICSLCGECLNFCPADAISKYSNKVHFDYDKCIRCYCCVEICPFGALRTAEPWLGKIYRILFGQRG